ncbi:dTDP-4-dehydrorhamnose reductase [Xylanibacter muris]|uniref:dTDP-4-dehydrorhamnose reductase n=1 Tax=Xylanibacter muris TaxID=2736290 RepID=A0ABX2AN03_9BACT|nr:dTDP-4-dehydrorhamnose reductase [Xylanibacter muris]NPD92611.1 dTDP-4-dehydrorhamnose reductase [Xylanibacter muris]
MNILITGCNGQLGNEIQLLERDWPRHKFFNTDAADLDITDKQAVDDYIVGNRIDGVVNCAAFTAVDKAETEKELCASINTFAPAGLAEAMERCGGWIIHISTDYVFDGHAHVPYTENDIPSPDSVYGSTKLAGEIEVSRKCSRSMIIRTAWLYSAFGNNFVKTMLRLGKERNEMGVVFDQIGTPTYARDLAVAIMTAIDKGIVPGIYHFSNEGAISWYDFTKAIHRIAGITSCNVRPIHTSEYPTSANRPAYSVLDKTKIKRTYGLTIPYWEEALCHCMERLKD